MHDSPTISAKALRVCVLAAARLGVPPEKLMGPLGVDPSALEDADAHVPLAWVARAWNEAPALTGDPYFGLHAAEMLGAVQGHVVDYIAQHCRTARELFEALVRYRRLMMSRSDLQLHLSKRAASFVMARDEDLPRVPQFDDFVVAQWALLLRGRASSGFPLRAVRFAHPAPTAGDLGEYARLFGAAVLEFDAPLLGIEFDPALLDVPFARADHTLASVLRRHADARLAQLAPAADSPSFLAALRAQLATRALTSETSMRAVARGLGLSVRSLQRRLHEAGTSYSDVLDGVRRELALRHLGEGRHSVGEVAFLVGFSQVPAFSRAFRRWTGESPQQWRRASGAAGTRSGAAG